MFSLPTTLHLGVHAPDRPDGGALAYQPGGLQRWLALFRLDSARGTYLATKVYDEGWSWKRGAIPPLTTAQYSMVEDAKRQKARMVISYCCFTHLHPGSADTVQPHRIALGGAMRHFLLEVASSSPGAAVIFCNEREVSWLDHEDFFFELEAEFGRLAKDFGLGWFVGGDLVEANTIETIRERMSAWQRHGVEPDAIAWHSYGQGGTLFRHVRDIIEATHRVAGRTFQHVWTEWGWGFPGAEATRADRLDLNQADTGAWCGGFALALQEAGAGGVFFTMLTAFDRTGEPTAATDEMVQTVKTGTIVEPRQPPPQKARAKTFRYLSAGRSAISAAFARSIARVQAAMS